MPTTTDPGTTGGLVAFGWDYDHGEFVVLNGQVPQPAREAIYQAGFSRRGDALDCWHQRRSVDPNEQIRRAGRLVDRLVAARVPVANWHRPEQRNGDVVQHYRWLQDEGPFPDVGRVAETAQAIVSADLAAYRLIPADRELAHEVVSGAVVVEAMHDWDDGVGWWLARTPEGADSHAYMILRHDPQHLNITDHYASWYGPQARRDFRATQLRDTTHPPATRAQAARPSRRARMAVAPTIAPLPPGPAPRRSASR
ncbi:hypothetical protein ACFVHB_10310 [Kitasatospora sp. NPDC127111]|uniref:hypothetical protein n=1 Tax=Kitasatospora sp. NPDC127111 TaxID=3345363 RepID=UPI0036266454